MGVSAPSLHRESTDSLITEKLSGASTFCLFGQDATISLAQITLSSNYSASVKQQL